MSIYDRYDYINYPEQSNMLGNMHNRTATPNLLSGLSMPDYAPSLENMLSPTPLNFNSMTGGYNDFVGGLATYNAPPRLTPVAPSSGNAMGGGTDWGSILKKVLGVGSLAAGGFALAGYGGSTTDFTPTMTAAKAQQMTAQAGTRAKAGIGAQASLAKSNVASQYVGRGLGSSGAAIGDIAGIGVKAGQAAGLVDTELNTQLAQMLMAIDQQEYMRQAAKAQEKRDIYGTLGDLALSVGMLLL